MIKVEAAAAGEVVSVNELKDHLHILAENTLEDDYLYAILAAATSHAEQYLNRFLLTTTVTEYFDGFPAACIKLARCPVQSITSFKYLDTDNAEVTLAEDTDYWSDLVSEPARIEYVNAWPTAKLRMNSVYVNYDCGYGDNGSDVPEAIRHAIKMIAAVMYEKREDNIVRLITNRDIMASYQLLDNFRINQF